MLKINVIISRAEDQVPSYPVAIAPELVEQLENCLQELNIQPINTKDLGENKEVNLMVCHIFTIMIFCLLALLKKNDRFYYSNKRKR